MGNWHLKSKDVDLFFCVNAKCKVITFREGTVNRCPTCHEYGSLVRSAKILPLGIKQ